MHAPHLLGRILLRFGAHRGISKVVRTLSAAALDRHLLWVASDEGSFLERLALLGPHDFSVHHRFSIGDLVKLHGTHEEIDIEALDVDGDSLWIAGSHSAKRKKPKGKGVESDLKRLATVRLPRNRLLIAKVPLRRREDEGRREPLTGAGRRLVATERDGNPSNALLDALADDPHLGPFLRFPIPSKDNGFDIEGLAVRGDTVFLGLRGPVLRGYAVLLVCELREGAGGELRLHPAKGRRYRKLFLDLDGLGIRELTLARDDLLILGGPTMALDGALRLFRLKNPFSQKADAVIHQDGGALTRHFDIPHTEQGERAEGVSLFSWFQPEDSLLVVYDAPAEDRVQGERAVFADVFRRP